MKIELNYNVVTAEERCNVASQMDLEQATERDLERVANYILYGKTEKGDTLPEAKAISTKHSTWKKREPESLDALLENINFDEGALKPLGSKSIYTKPKPSINREKDASIPGMVQLWEAIDCVNALYEAEKALGKSLRAYYLRHALIDLRKEQYYLKDLFKPTMNPMGLLGSEPQEIEWTGSSGYAVTTCDCAFTPDGVLRYRGEADWEWHTIAEHDFDFTNPTHIYHLLDNYSGLKMQVAETPTSPTAFLLLAIEKLIEKTKLSPSRMHILIRKIDHAPNDVVARELEEQFGLKYAINYISTIWTKEICLAIAKQGEIDLEEWQARNSPKKWKTCIKCHTKKLRDNRFFAKKKNTHDQLSPVCRECAKELKTNGSK